MKKNFNNKKLIILISSIVILIVALLSFINKEDNNEEKISLNTITKTNETTIKENESFYVDVKGSVKKPGVYNFRENDRVIDAINLAGGLKKDADTSNINLSKKLTNEMVIYVYSKKEIKSKDTLSCNNICNVEVIEVNNCIELDNSENDLNNSINLVNIYTASLEELLTLSGIGESKAKSIIEYRNSNGNFNSIEDLKNVSGIGDALFEKIKDKITV